MIVDTFFGQLNSTISYLDKSGQQQIQEVKETFAEVMMNVIGTKDLYEAWENLYHDSVDDYKTSEGETTRAEKTDWIVRVPEVFYI